MSRSLYTVKLISRAAPGPGWLVYLYKTDFLYLCLYLTSKPPNQSPPNFTQTSPPTQWRFLTQVWPPDFRVQQTLSRSREKKHCFTKNVQKGDLISLNFSQAVPGPSWLVSYNLINKVCFILSMIFQGASSKLGAPRKNVPNQICGNNSGLFVKSNLFLTLWVFRKSF